MDALNHAFFLWINASDPGTFALLTGKVLAKYLVYLFPVFLVIGWLRSNSTQRDALIQAVLVASLAIVISWLIGKIWFYPRPFVSGIGNNFLVHQPTASFPSNHLSLIWGVCTGLYSYRYWRKAAMALALIGLSVAWARIYMGVHYPLDMAGALVNAIFSALICLPLRQRFTPFIRSLTERIYRIVFGWLINTGLAKP